MFTVLNTPESVWTVTGSADGSAETARRLTTAAGTGRHLFASSSSSEVVVIILLRGGSESYTPACFNAFANCQ